MSHQTHQNGWPFPSLDANSAEALFLGVDTGGTFTDFVLLCDQQITAHKVLSTPSAPERAIFKVSMNWD